ncbi:hypothetical protein VOLCADRAFT_89782 [Volvox carteri f. nagariensis]|uniref:J domain-containing protein n=1 Tax=Volvox carteri f. nagariensis TaxID=3068 RepID=D8TSM2_VOLCA|nr:uncharacterized protein VOLCADRAFT_89782 [Volvox carteri f. nagariensis]EFJ49512.1 hypothetical protein VOLCADRAFT_89782 [Volvox carteri f. nagariensis]|eukprot:XP_002949493.1 hypothetical protein VOLCADRAFT_89782 [Volvox carteri f. nagariensis]
MARGAIKRLVRRTHLGDSVTMLSSLRVLDLAWNSLAIGPWVHLLARLPQLVELDLRGNPVCDLEGSQQLLAAALPGLQRLNGIPLRLEAEGAQPLQQPQQQQQQPAYQDGSSERWASPRDGRLEAEVMVLRLQLEAATRAHDTLSEAHSRLLAEREQLVQRPASLAEALRQAEEANAQLQQQSTSSVQQVAGLASQVATLLAERDGLLRQTELLGSRLADAEARAAEAAQAASRAAQQVMEQQTARLQIQQELTATQNLLAQLQQQQQHRQAAQSSALAGMSSATGSDGAAAAEGFGQPWAGAATSSPHKIRSGADGGGAGSGVESALYQRVEALQQIVRMQERELVRLGGLTASQAVGGGADGDTGQAAAAEAGWENLLQPWREQVQLLQEQLGRQAAEGEEQRAEWGQQLGEMREQFTQARTLLELLEQRSREQRSENTQLQAKITQLVSELQQERQRATGLEQQVAARDAAAQAVRRQLVAFKTTMEQREAALEDRAEQLSAHAERLSHASKRLSFALSLAAYNPPWPTRRGRPTEALVRCQWLEVELAAVSSSAEERIRAAQERMQEREVRQREALLAARLQAAQQAVEASAERKVQAAEVAAAAQVAQARQLVQGAMEAAEELCRRTEAAVGLRLSKISVRLQDLTQQVAWLRRARQRAVEDLQASSLELERLRHEVASRQASEADLQRQLASRERETHARLAELRADHEEALAAERRRAAEAERVAAKAAAECGQLERQLARVREVRAQQEDTRLRRLQSQVHEQEAQLRSLRRERNTLLAELRKQQGLGVVRPPQPHPKPAQIPQPTGAKPGSGDDPDEVEIMFERPAPPAQKRATGPKGPPASGTVAAAAQGPELNGESQDRESEKPSQAGARTDGYPLRSQKRQAATSQHQREQTNLTQVAQSANPTQRPKQPAAAAPAPAPAVGQQRTTANKPQMQPTATTKPASVPGPKRKFEDAFVGEAAGRPGKRPVQETRPAAAAAAGDTPASSAAAAATATADAAEAVFAARHATAGGGPRASGVGGTATAPVGGAACGGGSGVAPAAGPGPVAADGVFMARGIRVTPLTRPIPVSTAVATAAATAATAPGGPPPTFNPGRSTRTNPEMEDAHLVIRNLRRDLAVLTARLRDEQTRAQQEAAAAEALRLRQEPMEREMRELRLKYQEALQREKQLTEQLNLYKARDRQQVAAQQAAQQAAAAQRAQQQATAQRAHQAAAAQQAAQQAAAAARAQAEFAKHFGQWGNWSYQQFGGHGVGQSEFESAWFSGAGPTTANGHASHPARGAAGPGHESGGGASGGGGTYGGADGSSMPSGNGNAAGARGAAGNGGGGASAAPPQQQHKQPSAAAEARDDPAVLAFASAPLPALDDNTPVRALKQFLNEAGAEGLIRLCAEKAELLALARDRINGWEIRRAVACSKLVSQAQGDRALFRVEPGPLQRSALVKPYRELIMRLHPDKNPGDDLATQAFQFLQESYKRLSALSEA